jgi:hypothetical protein
LTNVVLLFDFFDDLFKPDESRYSQRYYLTNCTLILSQVQNLIYAAAP